MAIQANVGVTLIAGVEPSFGAELAAGATVQSVRRVSSSLSTVKAAFASNEVRKDQQISDIRHGGIGVSGSIEGELSTESYDPFIEALMRGTWVAGVSTTQTAWTTPNVGFTVIEAGELYRATFGASGGSLIAQGYRVGDVLRFTNLTGATSLNGKNIRVVTLTATTMDFTILDESTLAASPTNAVFTLSAVGAKLTNGIIKRSFSIEQSYDDIDVSELFSGMRVGSGSIRIPPNGMATAGFGFQGRNGRILTAAEAPHFTAPGEEGNTQILTGIGGQISIAGAVRSIMTSFDLNLNNNLSAPPVIGTQFVPEIFYGRHVVTGSVSAFLEDESLIAAFLNESNVELAGTITGAEANADFLSFSMQNVKFTGAQKSIGPEGGVIVQFPFQARLKKSPGFDSTTITIQRSNAL